MLRINASGGLNTCKSRGSKNNILTYVFLATGKRVSNTYVTFLMLRDSLRKLGLIPHNTIFYKERLLKFYYGIR